MYGKSMRCIKNLEDQDIWGNYNTGNAGNIGVVFEKCDSEKNAKNIETAGIVCASEDAIADWARGRYIIMLENENEFISHRFDDERFKKRAELSWFALNTDSRMEYVKMVTRIRTELNDEYLSFADSSEEIAVAFTVD